MEEVPEGLHENQYAMYALENGIGRPATKANIELIASCIKSISKIPRLELKGNLPRAMRYLIRAVQLANEQRVEVDYGFFSDAAYLKMRPVQKTPTYEKPSREFLEATRREQSTPEFKAIQKQMDDLLKKLAGQTKMEGAK